MHADLARQWRELSEQIELPKQQKGKSLKLRFRNAKRGRMYNRTADRKP